jgi:transposase
MVLMFARNGMTASAIARLINEHDTRVWRILEHYVDAARDSSDFSNVSLLGVDETSRAKGHDYVTLFVDMLRSKVLFVTAGKDSSTVSAFREDFTQHGGKVENVREFSMDMSRAFIKGVSEQFPGASLTFDRFHVIHLANEAVDEVRRTEHECRPELKGTRYLWLKDEKTEQEKLEFDCLRDSNLKTARAWRLKDTLRKLYEQPPDKAQGYLKKWYYWASHSRLKPFVKLAKTIKNHWDGILRWFASSLTQGLVEGINSLVQAAKARARGFRSVRKMSVTIYLIAGKLDEEFDKMFPSVIHTE